VRVFEKGPPPTARLEAPRAHEDASLYDNRPNPDDAVGRDFAGADADDFFFLNCRQNFVREAIFLVYFLSSYTSIVQHPLSLTLSPFILFNMSEINISLSSKNIQILKRLASEKDLLLNDFLTQEIEKWADRELRYEQAKERQIALMKKGIDLGFQSDEPPSRDSLHER
jgi:hypothetical protein